MLLNPHDIQYFQVIAQTKNLRAAAERLHITQPALSHALRRLETALGEPLFERISKGLKLTKVGVRLLEDSKDALQKWALLNSASETHGDTWSPQEALRVGMHPSVATYFAAPFLAKVRLKFPKVGFDLVHGLSRDVTRMVMEGELDVAIAMNPTRSPGLVIREILTDSVMLVGTKSAHGLDHVILDPALAQSQWLLRTIEKKGFKFGTQTHSSSLEVIRSLAESGLGVAVLPMRVANLARVKLVPILNDGPTFRDRLCFVCRPHFVKTDWGRAISSAAREAATSIE